MISITSTQLIDIANMIKFLEEADFKFDNVYIKGDIVIAAADDPNYILGKLICIDGGIWNFEPA